MMGQEMGLIMTEFLLLLGLLQIFSPVLRVLQQPEDHRLAEVQAASVLPHGRDRHLRLQPDGRDPHVSRQQRPAQGASHSMVALHLLSQKIIK